MENQSRDDSGVNPKRSDRFAWEEEGELEIEGDEKEKKFQHHEMKPSPFKDRKFFLDK